MKSIIVAGIAVCVFGWAVSAGAGVTPDVKCKAKKCNIAGKYYFCREKAEKKGILKGQAPDYSKCTAKFDDKWNKEETKGAGFCPDNVLTAPMNAYIAAQATEAAAIIAGTQDVPTCGDNTINVAGEQCDGTDLGGEDCTTLGFSGGTLACSSCGFDTSGCANGLPKTGQTTSYGTGSDGDVQAGQARSFTDNGDGTITDNVTHLMWEEKDDNNLSGVHDMHNIYTWGMNTSPYTMNGTMVTDFLVKMNDRCDGDETVSCTQDSHCTAYGNGLCGHAGHRDWRVPNLLELETIWDMEKNNASAPTTFAAFDTSCSAGCIVGSCSCTRSYDYWSSTTYPSSPNFAWGVYFSSGLVGNVSKSNSFNVRAVRGGL